MKFQSSLFSLKLVFAVSLSLSISQSISIIPSSFLPPLHNQHPQKPPSQFKCSRKTPICQTLIRKPNPKSIAQDLISLLGSKEEAGKVDPQTAKDMKSCLKFLAPISNQTQLIEDDGFVRIRRRKEEEEEWWERRFERIDDLIRWPPAAVMELSRLAVDSGGDPAAIQRILDPTMYPVPDVEGCKEDRCQLTRTTYGRRFINKDLNMYLAFLFEVAVARASLIGLNMSLSRYDLFHGHMFLATNSGRLGILFHAREYPKYDEKVFPYFMGYCQKGSNVKYDTSINLRNILWLAPLPGPLAKSSPAWVAEGVLVALDANPEGIVYRELIPDYVKDARTIYEDDFGADVLDVNYLDLLNALPEDKIFLC